MTEISINKASKEVELIDVKVEDTTTKDDTKDSTTDSSSKLDTKMIDEADQDDGVDLTYNPDGIPTWQAFFLNFKA